MTFTSPGNDERTGENGSNSGGDIPGRSLGFVEKFGGLTADLRQLIEAARVRAARMANSELVILNWQIGKRIRHEILAETRAGYGEQIVSTLSRQLQTEYGAGFSR